MSKKTYWELLKDPRWQRKRLEILNAADFKCEQCASAEKPLHVHHKIYRKGAMPWEYEDHELAALCEDCHESETQLRAALAEVMALLTVSDLDKLLGYAEGMALLDGTYSATTLRNYEFTEGMCAAAGRSVRMDVEDLMDVRDEKNRVVCKQLHEFADAVRRKSMQ